MRVKLPPSWQNFYQAAMLWPLSLVVLSAIAGCTAQGKRSCEVTGNVSIDGKPVQVGQITFDIVEEGDLSSSCAISEGTYRVQISPGRKIVRISAPDIDSNAGGTLDEDGFQTQEPQTARDLVPSRYAEEPLEVEITGSGVHDFLLTSE